MNSNFYLPVTDPEAWKAFLAKSSHWKTGYSAKCLAYSWNEARGFPAEVRKAFSAGSLGEVQLLLAIPEHQVPLPGGSTASQNDLWVLGRTRDALVSISVEGKVNEAFGPTLGEWLAGASTGKHERIGYLKKVLGLDFELPDDLRYQLFHRTASAVIEARRFHSKHAVMVVHSFSQEGKWFEDFASFVELFGVEVQKECLLSVGMVDGIELHLGWVTGASEYLTR